MSQPPIPPLFNGKAGWVAVAIAMAIFISSILLVGWLWVQCSEQPPPGSDLPEPPPVTATPQFPKAYVQQ
jgi:hypothetical protein